MNPHQVTKDFERALCSYTGAPFAVAVTSCTAALMLSVAWHLRHQPRTPPYREPIEIPKRTYCSVPMSIYHGGGRAAFRDESWNGEYQLKPLPIIDSARRFTNGMYQVGEFRCCSFHTAKILADTQGGCILHDNYEADQWLRRARFDGRTEGVPPAMDKFTQIGWHCYLSPDVAARLLWKLSVLPKHNEPLQNDPYPDLSLHEAFK